MSSQARRTGQQADPDSSHASGKQVPPQHVSPTLQQCASFLSPQGGPNGQQRSVPAALAEELPMQHPAMHVPSQHLPSQQI